jgi:hypothetical protein
MQTNELINTAAADYLLETGSLRYRFVEVDDTTLAPVKPSGAPIHEGEVGWPLQETVDWLEGRGVEVVELDAVEE